MHTSLLTKFCYMLHISPFRPPSLPPSLPPSSPQYPRFMQLLIDTVIEAIETKDGGKVDTAKMKFLKMPYKGKPHPTIIRESKKHSKVSYEGKALS